MSDQNTRPDPRETAEYETAEYETIENGTGGPRPAPVKSATSARQGITTGRVRWILGVSLCLAVIAMAVAYWVA